MSTKRRTPGVFSSPTPRNDKGERLCRNCKAEGRETVMRKGTRRHNCCPNCAVAWAIKTTPALMRRAVFERDKGVCARCRVDTVAQKAEFRAIPTMVEREVFRKLVGVPASRDGDWWDADHIKPVVEGGGECGFENYRTLCIPCHKAVTRELRGRIAKADREKRAVENDKAGLFADQVEA